MQERENEINKSNEEQKELPTVSRIEVEKVTDEAGETVMSQYFSEAPSPDEIAYWLPKTWEGKANIWTQFVRGAGGVAPALSKNFQQWIRQKIENGETISQSGEGSNFGELGDLARQEAGAGQDINFKKFSQYILEHIDEYTLDQLGAFGRWINDQGLQDKLNQKAIKEIAEAYLND